MITFNIQKSSRKSIAIDVSMKANECYHNREPSRNDVAADSSAEGKEVKELSYDYVTV